MIAGRRLILDLKGMNLSRAIQLTEQTATLAGGFKAHDLFDIYGVAVVMRELKNKGALKVWVDYKLHDMPDTVAERAKALRDAGVDMVTVHAAGGLKMIEAAVKHGPPVVIGVTKLTSWTDEMIETYYRRPAQEVVLELALWTKEGGAHALVCAARQVSFLASQKKLAGLQIIVPGTRSTGVKTHDQQQVDTPFNAISNGAYYLVAGRQVTLEAPDPLEALKAMALEITPALEWRK